MSAPRAASSLTATTNSWRRRPARTFLDVRVIESTRLGRDKTHSGVSEQTASYIPAVTRIPGFPRNRLYVQMHAIANVAQDVVMPCGPLPFGTRKCSISPSYSARRYDSSGAKLMIAESVSMKFVSRPIPYLPCSWRVRSRCSAGVGIFVSTRSSSALPLHLRSDRGVARSIRLDRR